LKTIKWFICGNGLGHSIRSRYIAESLVDRCSVSVSLFIVSASSLWDYAFPERFSCIRIGLEEIPRLMYQSNEEEIIVSDNLLLPLWAVKDTNRLMFHCGSFLWSRTETPSEFSMQELVRYEEVLLSANVTTYANKYFFSQNLNAPACRRIFHSLTDFNDNLSYTDGGWIDDKSIVYVSLGSGYACRHEISFLIRHLATLQSNLEFHFDHATWDMLPEQLDNLKSTYRRLYPHMFYIKKCTRFIIRPGLGTVNDILCKGCNVSLVCCNYTQDPEIDANIQSLRALDVSVLSLGTRIPSNKSSDLLDFLLQDPKSYCQVDKDGINEISLDMASLINSMDRAL